MVQVVTSDYLDAKTAKDNGVTSFTVLEEFEYQDGKFGRKLQGKARFNDKLKTEGTLSLNKTNQKKITELTQKSDSKDWVGKSFDFVITQQVVEGKMHDVIFVTGISKQQSL